MLAPEIKRPSCEACRRRPATSAILDGTFEQPFHLCHDCGERLNRRALRPLEWFNLAAVHGWQRPPINDDLYEQDGTAVHPRVDDYSVSGLSAPTLEDASKSLPRLVDYCVTRWLIETAEFDAFKAFPPHLVLEELRRRTHIHNPYVLTACLRICANALQGHAADWVRAQFDTCRKEDGLFTWAEAAAGCLPEHEGLHRTVKALCEVGESELRYQMMALVWFRSPIVLKWIETNAPRANITEEWGQLASLSQLNWTRVQSWLIRGRPLSLIALDALRELVPRPRQAWIESYLNPKLEGCDDRSKIRDALQDYVSRDDAPRAVQRYKFIIENLGELRME